MFVTFPYCKPVTVVDMRLSCFSLLLMLATLGAAQDLSKPVTYRTVAVPLQRALEAISAQAGVQLIASDELADEPIILVINGSKTSEVMDHIASAMSALWRKQSAKTIVLERNEEMEAKLEAKDEADRAVRLQKAIDAFVKGAKTDQEWTPDYRDTLAKTLATQLKAIDPNRPMMPQSFERTPIRRLFARFLQLITAAPFSKMETTCQYCFSTDPNTLELPIPGDWKSAVDQFMDEQNSFSSTFTKLFGEVNRGATPPGYYESQMSIETVPNRFVIRVTFMEGEPQPMLEMLALTGPYGNFLQANTYLQTPFTPEEEAKFRGAAEKSKTEQMIPLSKESKIVQEACRAVNKYFANPPPLANEAAALLLDPANHDPLSFQTSDGFIALAAAKSENLVVYPPDDLVRWTRSAAVGRFTLSTFQTMLNSVDQDVRCDWLEVTPKQPLEAWKTRCNRPLAGDCFQEGQRLGYISIDTAAKLALSQRVPGQVPLLRVMEQFGTEYSPFYQRDTRLLRFYGSLDESQLRVLAAGGLHVGALQREQYGYLQDWVYQSLYVNPDFVPRNAPSAPSKIWSVTTQAVPDGVPMNAVVHMANTVSDLTFVGLHFYNTATPIDSFESAAFNLAWSKRHPEENTGVRTEWFAPGKVHDLAFNISLPGDWKGEGHLREETMSDVRWTIDQLPADIKSKWEAAVKDAQDQYEMQYPSSTPPPTPPRQTLAGLTVYFRRLSIL